MLWRMFGYRAKRNYFIFAESFDEAIRIARLIDPEVNGGQRVF